MSLDKNGRATLGLGGTPPVDRRKGHAQHFDEDGEAVSRTEKTASSRRGMKDAVEVFGTTFGGKEGGK